MRASFLLYQEIKKWIGPQAHDIQHYLSLLWPVRLTELIVLSHLHVMFIHLTCSVFITWEYFRKTDQEECNGIFPFNAQGWTCMLKYTSAVSWWRSSHRTERHVRLKQTSFLHTSLSYRELDSWKAVKRMLSSVWRQIWVVSAFFPHAHVLKHGHSLGVCKWKSTIDCQKTIPTHKHTRVRQTVSLKKQKQEVFGGCSVIYISAGTVSVLQGHCFSVRFHEQLFQHQSQ